MTTKAQDQDPATIEGQGSGTDKTEDKDADKSKDSKLTDPAVQAEIDRRVTTARKKWETEREQIKADAQAAAKREAEEAKLLEDQKFEELAKRKEQEANEARAALESYKRKDKVNALLDKKGVTDPNVRALFLDLQGDLAAIDERVDAFLETIKANVDKVVNDRLGTTLPPKGSDVKPKKPEDMTPDEWAAYKRSKGVI